MPTPTRHSSIAMTSLAQSLPQNDIRPMRGETFISALNRFVPLGRKYHPLIRLLNGQHGLLAIPFDQYRVLRPAAWTKSVASQLLVGVDLIPEFQLLRPLCSRLRDGHLVDVGANIGLYTLLLRSASALPIIAYEPQPLLHQLLTWNVEYNRLPAVEARRLACGAQQGEVSFSLGLNGSVLPEGVQAEPEKASDLGGWEQEARVALAGGATVRVPVTTLDEDLANVPSIAFLKIDCEGFEYPILQGARKVLAKHRPLLFIEVHPQSLAGYGYSTQAVLDLVAPDYELEFWSYRTAHFHSKLARSLAKFDRPKAHRYADAAEMLAAANKVPGPSQVYFLGRPKGHL